MSDAIAITNVRVFDGNALTEERTVTIDNGVLSDTKTADTIIDGQQGTLLPGLIDCHVHVSQLANLEQGTRWGVTTMLDMVTTWLEDLIALMVLRELLSGMSARENW